MHDATFKRLVEQKRAVNRVANFSMVRAIDSMNRRSK